MMKTLSAVLLLSLVFCHCSPAESSYPARPDKPLYPAEEYPLTTKDISCRDPHIFVNREDNHYYFAKGLGKSGIRVYKSRDLVNWADAGIVWTPAADFWGKADFWAPDMIEYEGKYYIFQTYTGTTEKRGVGILVADSPTGPYEPLVNYPLTPSHWMCLDGTLYIDDNGDPWMLYIRDWLDGVVGAVYAQRFSSDLTELTGAPVLLFEAGSAPWAGVYGTGSYKNFVADSPWILNLPNGRKTMIWSSFTSEPQRYAIGQLYSTTGTLSGPWQHDPQPLNTDDGGHCMVFTDLVGKMKIAYHSPNSLDGKLISGHPTIKDIAIDENGRITIIKQ